MRKFKFSKLVRDKIVKHIVHAGDTPYWQTLTDEEYIKELKMKLMEEAQEVPSAQGDSLIEELADVQEIINHILLSLSITPEEFQKVVHKKNNKMGKFKGKQYIDYVEVKDDSKWVNYYLAQPNKYPEIK